MLTSLRNHYSDLFSCSPMAAAILDARTLKLETANSAMLELWDRDQNIIGLPILDFLPEIADQEYPDLLNEVARSGKAHRDQNASVSISRKGLIEKVFMDYSYTPIMGTRSVPIGILIMGTEITQKQLNSLSSEEHRRNLRAMVLDAPVAMCVYRGKDLNTEVVNGRMLDLWQKQEQRNIQILQHVFFSGMPFNYVEHGVYYSCTALRNNAGNSVGCVLIGNKL